MKKYSSYFVTGTDTEVGKTLVSGALILKLRASGLCVSGFKPVVAGTYLDHSGKTRNEDVETLRIASNLSPNDPSLCPYILDQAAAPHIAANAQTIRLEAELILQAFRDISTRFDAVIVEGAGGFLVPLNDQEDLGDIAQAMDLPIILVVGMQLGCINHALLTYEAIQARNLIIAGWVANTLSIEMPSLNENLKTLKNRISAPFFGLMPTLPKNLQKLDNTPYSLEALQFAAEHLELER